MKNIPSGSIYSIDSYMEKIQFVKQCQNIYLTSMSIIKCKVIDWTLQFLFTFQKRGKQWNNTLYLQNNYETDDFPFFLLLLFLKAWLGTFLGWHSICPFLLELFEFVCYKSVDILWLPSLCWLLEYANYGICIIFSFWMIADIIKINQIAGTTQKESFSERLKNFVLCALHFILGWLGGRISNFKVVFML